MTCAEVQRLLQLYSDNELDLVWRLQIEAHLAECAACAEQSQRLRALRETIGATGLRHRPPAALRARVESAIARPLAERRPWSWRRMAVIAAAVVVLVGIATSAGIFTARYAQTRNDRLAELVVAGHLRSLQVNHLTDVVSTDRHTVKPWFQGKLSFSPHVPDLAVQGYVLVGGRMDYLADQPVAAIVYQRRKHTINCFMWPAADAAAPTANSSSRQGFQIRSWEHDGIVYVVVSDLNGEELDDFVRSFQRG